LFCAYSLWKGTAVGRAGLLGRTGRLEGEAVGKSRPLGRARLQPCQFSDQISEALASEVRFWNPLQIVVWDADYHDNERIGYDSTIMHSATSKANTRYGRLKAIGAGVAIAAVGILRLRGGVQVVTYWTGQPMFSWGLIAAGAFCILSAFLPKSWIAKAAGTPIMKGKSSRRSR
jgi:hypothetical protein